MRIGYIFNSSIPSNNPGSLQIIKTCEGLIRQNNEVVLITPNTGLDLPLKKFYNLKKIPKVIKIKFFTKFPLGISYYLYSIFSVIYAMSLKFDVIITRNLFILFILTLFKKKTIVEIHHDLTIESRIVRFIFYRLNVFKSKNIIKIIAITKKVKEYLLEDFKINPKKIQVIPSATDLKFKFNFLNKKKKLNIGYFGSLEKGKGADFTCKLSKLDNKNNYFVCGGTLQDVKKIRENYKNLNLFLEHHKPYSAMSKLIDKMDVLLIPSDKKIIKATGGVGNLSKFTSPLKLFDYLASGKLIILSNLEVYKEIIKKNHNCIMVDNLSRVNWLKEINQLNLNLSKINRLKKNAFNLSKKYTYYKRASEILKNIKEFK